MQQGGLAHDDHEEFNARMGRLTEKHEAWAQSVELSHGQMEYLRGVVDTPASTMSQMLPALVTSEKNMMDSIKSLTNVVTGHERRLNPAGL